MADDFRHSNLNGCLCVDKWTAYISKLIRHVNKEMNSIELIKEINMMQLKKEV